MTPSHHTLTYQFPLCNGEAKTHYDSIPPGMTTPTTNAIASLGRFDFTYLASTKMDPAIPQTNDTKPNGNGAKNMAEPTHAPTSNHTMTAIRATTTHTLRMVAIHSPSTLSRSHTTCTLGSSPSFLAICLGMVVRTDSLLDTARAMMVSLVSRFTD